MDSVYRAVHCSTVYLTVTLFYRFTIPCTLPFYRTVHFTVFPYRVPYLERWYGLCGGQVNWISGQKGDAKKAGILAAVAKLPTLLKKLEAAATAAVGPKGKEEVSVETYCTY